MIAMRRLPLLALLLLLPLAAPHLVAQDGDDVVAKLGALNWNTNEGKSIDDAARGLALRSWANVGEAEGKEDVYITWPSDQHVAYVAVDLYIGWRSFPAPRLTTGNKYFDPDYIKAIFANETAQTKRVRIEGEAATKGMLVDRWGKNGPIDYYYVKVVGVTADGSFFDIKEVCVGSRMYREDPRFDLPNAPDDAECFAFKRPDGNRNLMTRWEPYGEEWAEGHKPALPPLQIANASAPIEEKLGVLLWDTNGGAYHDGEQGTTLRVWANTGNKRGNEDLLIHLAEPVNPKAKWIDVFFGWRLFPVRRLRVGDKYYDPEYIKALHANATVQGKHVRVEADVFASGWMMDSVKENGPIDYYYIKLVGVTEDERYFDIRDWSVGTVTDRADERWKIEAAPEDLSTVGHIKRPKGGSYSQMTKWEPYGTEWAPGHEPPPPVRYYPEGSATLLDKLAALNWDTNGGKMDDSGTGSALRVWDNTGGGHGKEDVFITWDPEQGHKFTHIDLWFAWRNFPVPRFTPASQYYDADYVQAIFNNEAAQSKRLRVPYPASHCLVDRIATNGTLEYYYVKPVGITEDGRMIDITHWSVASTERRADPRWELEGAPDGAVEFKRPKGDRNLKTKWEKYGTKWAEGHEPPKIEKNYPAGSASIVDRMGALTWETNGGRQKDDGGGYALRNWEMDRNGNVDIIVSWGEQSRQFAKFHLFAAWRNFPVPRFTVGDPYHDADYVKAIWDNEAAQSKHTTIDAATVPGRAFVLKSGGKPHAFYYLKLAGETADGQLVDIDNWSIGSAGYRADPRWELPAPPQGAIPSVELVLGDRNLMTRWEPYGTSWARGHEPARPMRTYPPGNSPIEVKLGGLNWETNEGKSMDDGAGTSLRNWEIGPNGNAQVIFMWGEQRVGTPVKIHVFWTWRNFPVPRLTTGGSHYDADYIKAIWSNETAQTKHLELDATKVPGNAFLDARSPNEWYYAKLVGETADGTLFDIEDWSIGSASYRADPRWKLPAPPEGELPKVDRPKGDRNLKTRWESYGTAWAPGHEPAGPVRIYPPGDADLVTKLGALDWNTNGGKATDDKKGVALRNWEMGGKGNVDIIFSWEEQSVQLAKIHVVWAWRNFPLARMTNGQGQFDADYLKAIWANEAAQSKHAEINVADAPKQCFIDSGRAGRPHQWYYAKLIGETADGQ
ncbi:MAG: hypothetical protein AB7K09_22110, partial [Planctomycetota bacterium]